MRMPHKRWTKRALNYAPPNRRRRRRPRVSWKQNVEHYMRDRAIDIEDGKKEIAINMPDASEAIGTPACME